MKRKKEIEKYLGNNSYIITLDIKGEKFTSEAFSKMIEDNFIFGNNNIVFVIGGSDGVGNRVKKLSNKLISFSDMTFPHGLFRAILLEQIYRAFKIMNNETYHK